MANAASNSNSSDPDRGNYSNAQPTSCSNQPAASSNCAPCTFAACAARAPCRATSTTPKSSSKARYRSTAGPRGSTRSSTSSSPRCSRAPTTVSSNVREHDLRLDITRRRFLLIDVDPTRPSKISSTDAELQLAYQAARAIVDDLTAWGFPAPARGCSGNGAHIVYAIDLDTNDSDLVTRFLKALAFKFNTAQVQIDVSVGKAGS